MQKKHVYSDKLPEKIKAFTGLKTLLDIEELIKSYSGLSDTLLYKRNKYKSYYGTETCEYFAKSGNLGNSVTYSAVPDPLHKNENNIISVYRKRGGNFGGIFMYATEAGTVYEAEVEFVCDNSGSLFGRGEHFTLKYALISKWKKARLHTNMITTVINEKQAHETLERINPYGLEFEQKHPVLKDINMLVAPELEQLEKAGYALTQSVLSALDTSEDNSIHEQFSRLCQPGKNMKQIFKTSKAVYTVLKNCTSLSTWDIYRKLDKQGKINAENIERAYANNYYEKELNEISNILNQEYNGKKIFNWDSLQKYLERIDMYEAIDRFDGLLLLRDYLNMCSQLDMKPRVDGDSLKREHDVTARTLRQKRDEIRAGKMVGICKENEKYDYSEHIYMGRCIRDYDDLIDEATQQHNCVASYADSIIAKRCYIFVVREVSNPGRSLATVELTPNGEIRQKLLAYNRPIHNKALTEFIDRLAGNFKAVRKASPALVA